MRARESYYDIPAGCICMGDGMMGMRCEAPKHARMTSAAARAMLGKIAEKSDDPDTQTACVIQTFLGCRSLGVREIPPTPQELAQREAGAFNETHPIGTMLRYWSGLKEGAPTGTAPIYHKATVVCGSAVIWMSGVSSCHSLSHVERENL